MKFSITHNRIKISCKIYRGKVPKIFVYLKNISKYTIDVNSISKCNSGKKKISAWGMPQAEMKEKVFYFVVEMKNKKQLTREQRYEIEVLLRAGKKQKEIAELVGKDKSVISRELKRNIHKRGLFRPFGSGICRRTKGTLPFQAPVYGNYPQESSQRTDRKTVVAGANRW
jgi:hypothetical protein